MPNMSALVAITSIVGAVIEQTKPSEPSSSSMRLFSAHRLRHSAHMRNPDAPKIPPHHLVCSPPVKEQTFKGHINCVHATVATVVDIDAHGPRVVYTAEDTFQQTRHNPAATILYTCHVRRALD